MFLAREASLRDSPNSLTASTVMPVRSTGCTANSPSGSLASPSEVERVGVVAGLGQVAAVKSCGVDDDRRALGQVTEVGLQRGRVHRDQHVRGVARGEDVVVGEVHLERRDARQRALRCADLGGEVRQRHQVVAERRRLLREPVAGQLHAVAGVTGEPDDHPVQLLDLLGHLVHSLLCQCFRPVIVPAVRLKLEHVPVLAEARRSHGSRADDPLRTGAEVWTGDARHAGLICHQGT